jgi:hypothetical protein
MGKAEAAAPVKLFCGIIAAGEDLFGPVRQALEARFGEIDAESPSIPFRFTEYYAEDMGGGLIRRFVSFRDLADPGGLADVKLATNRLEEEFAVSSSAGPRRRVNLDPGYVTLAQVVLATTKNFGHRIYLRDGIYAEVTLNFLRHAWRAREWTYPDYRSEEYQRFFLAVRERYEAQIRPETGLLLAARLV